MNEVLIYSTPNCVYCKLAKEFLSAHSIPYREIDVASDDKALEEMVEKTHQRGVPVIEIGDEIFVGFDKRAIAEALGITEQESAA